MEKIIHSLVKRAKRHCPSVTQRAVGKGEVFTRRGDRTSLNQKGGLHFCSQ